MIAKVGLGLLGLSAIGVGGVVVTKPYLLGMDYMPNYTTLSKKERALTDKWVKDYRIYFVDSEGNDYWFDWVFRNRYNQEDNQNKTVFAGIKQGWGNTTNNSLAKACKDAYDKTSADIGSTDSGTADGKIFEDNIWKYCSVGGKKLKTVSAGSDKGNYNNGLGNSHESELLSTTETDNDWAWHIKQEEFLKGSRPTDQGVLQKFYNDNKKYEKEKNGTKLKDGCKFWYGQEEKSGSGVDKLTAAEVKKYCSVKVDGSNA